MGPENQKAGGICFRVPGTNTPIMFKQIIRFRDNLWHFLQAQSIH